METQNSSYYLYGIIKNITFFIVFYAIFFFNLMKYHPNAQEWTPLLLLDYLGLPATIIFLGYLFLYLFRVSGCLFAIIGPLIVIFVFAYVIDTVIAKLGLPANYWPYAFGILGILLNIINIVKLIYNIRWYRLFKFGETQDL